MKKNRSSPPRIAHWILENVFSDRGRFTHLGDFTQVFNQIVKDKGYRHGWIWYWSQTLNALPWFLSIYFCWSIAMIKNFIITAFRYMYKRKGFSLINILGLAFGIAIIILIGQFLYFEFSYDKFHPKLDQIYHVADKEENSYRVDYRIKDRILENIPQVNNACLYRPYATELNAREHVFEFEHVLLVDPAFFEIFHFPFVQGNGRAGLANLNSIILTESASQRIFGSEDPIGQMLVLNHKDEMFVSGIIADFPPNSSFQADLIASAENTKHKRLSYGMDCLTYDGVDDSQCRYPYGIFLELSSQADPASVEKQINSLFTGEDYRYPNTLTLTPFKHSYLHNQYRASRLSHGNLGLLQILSLIGLLVLVLAIMNYINLTTAAYNYRIKEIGVKKCLGVNRRPLIFQFMGESLIVCLFAAGLGLILAKLFLPFFNQFVDMPLHIQVFTNANLFIMFVLFIVCLGALAGIYPAFILSGILPIQLLRSGAASGRARSTLRNILNVFQFAVTICLMIGLMIMLKQIHFVKHKDLGFDTDRLVNLKLHHKMGGLALSLQKKLQQYPGITDITLTSGIPGKISMTMGGFKSIIIDDQFLNTFGLKIIQGRNLLPGDINKACLVNEAGLQKFENRDFRGQKANTCEVVGVVSDFHYTSLHQEIGPLALFAYDEAWGRSHLSFKLSGSMQEGIEFIKNAWMTTCPDFLFEFHFYDEWFDVLYRKEENLAKMISIFSILAIVISCLGLFGLALFNAEQRTKEIGIRKVLGSSIREIVLLLTKTALKWALIANLIAWPLAWWVMSKWLENFAYRTVISWWVFAAASGSVLLLAVLTISWQTVRAALADPVEALRYE